MSLYERIKDNGRRGMGFLARHILNDKPYTLKDTVHDTRVCGKAALELAAIATAAFMASMASDYISYPICNQQELEEAVAYHSACLGLPNDVKIHSEFAARLPDGAQAHCAADYAGGNALGDSKYVIRAVNDGNTTDNTIAHEVFHANDLWNTPPIFEASREPPAYIYGWTRVNTIKVRSLIENIYDNLRPETELPIGKMQDL